MMEFVLEIVRIVVEGLIPKNWPLAARIAFALVLFGGGVLLCATVAALLST